LLAEIEVAVRLVHTGSPGWLAPGARLALISFHSLEDRMIKQRFAKMAQDGLLESRSRKPVTPSDLEVRVNARARSGKLRWATVGTSGP
jgi:16S rRNA (cytosine1402-N4)-methyltransferase